MKTEAEGAPRRWASFGYATEYPYGRFQFVWYGWRGPWLRCYFERFGGSMKYVYRWRIAAGPFDLRRWRAHSEGRQMLAESVGTQGTRRQAPSDLV